MAHRQDGSGRGGEGLIRALAGRDLPWPGRQPSSVRVPSAHSWVPRAKAARCAPDGPETTAGRAGSWATGARDPRAGGVSHHTWRERTGYRPSPAARSLSQLRPDQMTPCAQVLGTWTFRIVRSGGRGKESNRDRRRRTMLCFTDLGPACRRRNAKVRSVCSRPLLPPVRPAARPCFSLSRRPAHPPAHQDRYVCKGTFGPVCSDSPRAPQMPALQV